LYLKGALVGTSTNRNITMDIINCLTVTPQKLVGLKGNIDIMNL
jgi:hypothetical protein